MHILKIFFLVDNFNPSLAFPIKKYIQVKLNIHFIGNCFDTVRSDQCYLVQSILPRCRFTVECCSKIKRKALKNQGKHLANITTSSTDYISSNNDLNTYYTT